MVSHDRLLGWPARVVAEALITVLLTLLVVIAIYACLRPVESALLLPASLSMPIASAPRWLALTSSLPTLGHVLVFGTLTALLLPARPRWVWLSFATWCLINVVFEVGQIPAVAAEVQRVLPQGKQGVAILDHLGAYLAHGVFDPIDVFAAAVAVPVGALMLNAASRKRLPNAVAVVQHKRRSAR